MSKNKKNKAAPKVEADSVAAAAVEAATPANAEQVDIEEAIENAQDLNDVQPDEVVEDEPEAAPLAGATGVSSNPSLLVWPTDQWGFTMELKKAILTAASGVRGSAEKKEMLDAVLTLGIAHIEAKYEVEAAVLAAAKAEAQAEAEAEAEAAEAETPAQKAMTF